MKKKPVVVALAMAFSSTAYAQQNNIVTEFDEVLVTATRINEKGSDTSRSVAVISEEALQSAQSNSVAEILRNEANVNVGNGPRASSQGVEIRGLGGPRVLQTIDGARQNTASGHRGTYFIDPELLNSVEVIRGPASSLWGSGAIGGVVAQNTKSAKDMLDEGEEFGGYLKQGFETNDDNVKTSGAIYGVADKFDWLINGSYSDSNNIKIGNDKTLENSASQRSSGLMKLGWEPSDAQRLQLSGRFSDTDERVPSNPAVEAGRESPLIQRKTKDTNLTLAHSFNPDTNPYLDLNSTLYWNSTDYDEDRLTLNQLDSTEYQTLGLSINNSSIFGDITLTYGVDGYQDTIKTVRDDSGTPGQRPDNIDGKTTVWGAFATAKVGISESVYLEPALRYDSFDNESINLSTSSDDSALSPSLGLVWETNSWLTLSARYDEAFRAPTVEEMYSSGTHFCMSPILCNTFEINPELKAEQAKNKELKADLRFTELVGNDELAITLNVFRNDVNDFIEKVVSMSTTSSNNVDKARLTGFEFSTRYRFEQTRLVLNYGQTEGKDKNNGAYFRDIPANKLALDLSQGLMEGDIKLGTRVTHVAQQNKLPANDTTNYDSYTLWDVYAAWEPAMGSLAGLRVDFAVENIGDKEYLQAWQTLYEQGINMKLSARYRF